MICVDQWRSSFSFHTCYLSHHLRDMPCTTLESHPSIFLLCLSYCALLISDLLLTCAVLIYRMTFALTLLHMKKCYAIPSLGRIWLTQVSDPCSPYLHLFHVWYFVLSLILGWPDVSGGILICSQHVLHSKLDCLTTNCRRRLLY